MQRYIAEERVPGPQWRATPNCWRSRARLARPVSSDLHLPHGRGSNAVVDERLRVRGIGGLRVVDGSIMPTVVSGNTNAAVVMIAEKGADMILHDAARATSGAAGAVTAP